MANDLLQWRLAESLENKECEINHPRSEFIFNSKEIIAETCIAFNADKFRQAE